MSKTCDGCLYLNKYSSGNYCEMRNRFIADLNQPICDKWKHKPKHKPKAESEWEWVQLEMDIDK